MDNQRAHTYDFGDFSLDAAKRLLLKNNGKPLSLTPKAFETLLYLVERGGAVLDKDELMRAVWPDTVVEENTSTNSSRPCGACWATIAPGTDTKPEEPRPLLGQIHII